MNRTIRRIVSVLTGIALLASYASAQVTNSALGGKVEDATSLAVPGAVVVAVHEPSGTKYHAVTNNEGRYFINGMRAGGPYTIVFSCLGYQKVRVADISLSLAETSVVNATLPDDSQILQEAIIVSDAAKFNTDKSGMMTNITNREIDAMPNVSRSITDVAKLSPYGGNGMSFAGSDGRLANFTVDGADFNNNFGLNDKLPGGGSPISIDAIDEIQVVIAPYDVRQHNFIGGGVNAITKSGTNTFKGSAYVYHRNEMMRGDYVTGKEISGARDKDRTTIYGLTLGGPIVKNQLFFFVNFERSQMPTVVNRWHPSEDGKADADKNISRTTIADMEKVSTFLKEKYGYDTGSATDFPADETNTKVLGRIDWNINDDNHLAVRYNFTMNRGWNPTNPSSSNCTQRTTQGRLSQYAMSFANSMFSQDNKVHSWSLDLNSRLGDELSNQLLATYSMMDDIRGSKSAKFPFIDILDGSGDIMPYISTGYELFTWNNGVHNRVLNVKDDLTYFSGSHKVTAGIAYEYQMADNAYMRNGTGYYRYNSLEDFLNGLAPETVALTYGYDNTDPVNPAARVRFHKPAIYAQDEWNATPSFKLTYGVRLEGIFFDNRDVMTNSSILGISYRNPETGAFDYHIDTGRWPTAKLQVNPRIGFTWDILKDQSLKLRGGTGLFTGRLPLVFFTNMPTNSGMIQNVASISTDHAKGTSDPLLAKFADNMIVDATELRNYLNQIEAQYLMEHPDEKRSNRFPLVSNNPMPSAISAVDPEFKMPQVWKTSLAIDYAFPTPFPMSLSVEGIFNKTINAVCLQDLNIKSTEGFPRLNNGLDRRHIYPADYKVSRTSAYLLGNTDQGYGWDASAIFKISPVKELDFTFSYAHVVSKELTGMPGSDAASAFTYVPTVEGPNNATLHNSQYVIPDRIFASLTYNDPAHNHWSLFYETFRGGFNYSYGYVNDLNGDSYNYDALYIPRTKEELSFASQDDADRFWAYVNKDSYLSRHKGEYAEAYSLYSPWVHRLDFRFAHDFTFKVGKSVNAIQINFDIKNVLNLFNNSWGVSKYINQDYGSDGIARILKCDSIGPDGVPVFSTPKAVGGSTQIWTPNRSIEQCWYAQIGLKYKFN